MARKKENVLPSVPQHIAIIMDGNGRWAKKRLLPRTAGHAAGAETFRRVADHCRKIGVKYLSVYAFSTENWKRSAEEVSGIMKLLGKYLDEAMRSNLKQVRIIHGKGTGTLRAAVQQSLRKNKFIKTFRLGQYGEGEDGVTIAEFG